MFLLPTKAALLDFQIWHYRKRLKEETRKKARKFLSDQIIYLLTPNN